MKLEKTNGVLVNNLKLPVKILERMNAGKWKKPPRLDGLRSIILEKCPYPEEKELLNSEIDDFELYSLELMKAESEYYLNKKREPDHSFLGHRDNEHQPGNIVENKIIYIADFGHGSDSPIALDYRNDDENPSVLFLFWHFENPEEKNRWVMLTSTYDDFDNILWK